MATKLLDRKKAKAQDLQVNQRDYDSLRDEAQYCTACHLYRHATQTVFGEGSLNAKIIMIGEQPGDQEDIQGHPFVGPAGTVLDRALLEAGIDRSTVYVTNAVKHFKWTAGGSTKKRRIHQKPDSVEIRACKPWLIAEVQEIHPRVLVCLGLTAAQSVLGRAVKLKDVRGKVLSSELCPTVVVTSHPSAILRIPDAVAKKMAFEQLVRDLIFAARL